MSMGHGEMRLAIDCGSVCTVAVVAWSGGWLPVQWDGSPWLSSAVHVSPDGRIETGQQAWAAAMAAPEGFEPAPLSRGQGSVVLAGVELAVVDLVAATLRRVAAEATALAGGPVGDVRLVAPAGWGPRRCTWLRQAAKRAGLPEVTVVPAPVAVADGLAATGLLVPVGAYLAVCDVGGGVEVSVLRRGPTGFEILSTLDDPGAGGRRIDELLAAQLDGHRFEGSTVDGGRWQVLASARAAREALSAHPTVTVGLPPIVLAAGQVEAVARPVLERVAALTVEAVEAAEVSVDQLAGVFLVGAGASMPAVARAVGEAVGRKPVVVADPGAAAVRGAAQATGAPAGNVDAAVAEVQPPLPPLRRVAGLAVPAVASLAVLVEFMSIEDRYGGRFNYPLYTNGFHALPNWGALAMASVFAAVACLCAAALLASVLPTASGIRKPAGAGVRMAGGLLAAAVMGMAVAGAYAVGGATYMTAPVGQYLRWAVLPLLPLLAVVVLIAVVVARWGRGPAVGWHRWLRFPLASIIPAAVGMLLIDNVEWHWDDSLTIGGLHRLGGLLIGVGAACAVVRPWPYRLMVAAPLGVVTAAITDASSTGTLGVIYAAAVTVWWLQRLWELVQQPTGRWLPCG
jgi:Hsp70 protein